MVVTELVGRLGRPWLKSEDLGEPATSEKERGQERVRYLRADRLPHRRRDLRQSLGGRQERAGAWSGVSAEVAGALGRRGGWAGDKPPCR
jgi:hypothetical protein